MFIFSTISTVWHILFGFKNSTKYVSSWKTNWRVRRVNLPILILNYFRCQIIFFDIDTLFSDIDSLFLDVVIKYFKADGKYIMLDPEFMPGICKLMLWNCNTFLLYYLSIISYKPVIKLFIFVKFLHSGFLLPINSISQSFFILTSIAHLHTEPLIYNHLILRIPNFIFFCCPTFYLKPNDVIKQFCTTWNLPFYIIYL